MRRALVGQTQHSRRRRCECVASLSGTPAFTRKRKPRTPSHRFRFVSMRHLCGRSAARLSGPNGPWPATPYFSPMARSGTAAQLMQPRERKRVFSLNSDAPQHRHVASVLLRVVEQCRLTMSGSPRTTKTVLAPHGRCRSCPAPGAAQLRAPAVWADRNRANGPNTSTCRPALVPAVRAHLANPHARVRAILSLSMSGLASAPAASPRAHGHARTAAGHVVDATPAA